MISNKIIKTRRFSLETTDLDEIKNAILKQNGIESVTVEQNKLIVSYDLRQNNFQKLKRFLSDTTTLKKEFLLNKLQSSFISSCERNEFDHANNPAGWHYYMQNLYLSLHKEHH
jgi:hypothetical protein